MRRLQFTVIYALRDLWRDRQRTAFALFSIAAGVATVVALRMLGLMLTDALTTNVRSFLRGDVVVQSNTGPRISFIDPETSEMPFNPRTIPQIQEWAKRNDVEVTFVTTGELTQAAIVRDELAGRPAFVVGYFIDPQVYPFYETIRANQPSGVLLKDLFDGPNQVVVGQRLANQLGIQVGDQLRIGTAKELHIVKGIVPDTSESSFTNPLSLLFSFMYLDRSDSSQFNVDPQSADNAFIKAPPGTDLAELKAKINAEWSRAATRVRIRTVDETLANNQVSSVLASRFILLLSLVALIIGGVGIVNTMLVAVNRRANEIAVLKTVGIRGGGVVRMFFIEALVMGFLGSLIGVVLGFGLSIVAQRFGEQAFGFALPWRFQIDPALLGVGMGVVITVIFSVLPTLMAGNVRPALVLRQGSLVLARAGCLPSLLSLLALILGVGTLIGLIVGDVFTLFEQNAPSRVQRFNLLGSLNLPPLGQAIVGGILAVVVLLIAFAIILLLAWIVIWFLSKLPSFRSPNLLLAIRGLTLYRVRTALSLLALVVGMTALSSTLILSRSVNQLLYTTVSGPLGGNVVTLPLLPLTDSMVRNRLDSVSGVRGYRTLRFPSANLVSINGKTDWRDELALNATSDFGASFAESRLELLIGVDVHGAPTRSQLYAGRYLTPEDADKRVMTLPYDPSLEAIGVDVGSKLTYRINGRNLTFEVVGLIAPDIAEGFIPFSLGDRAAQVPLAAVTSTAPFDITIADVQTEKVNDVMAAIGVVPGVFVFDVGVFDEFLSRLFTQLAALPLLVAGLSLFAAGALIATTVSLATLERRRQIGILKSFGVRRDQVLGQLLIENGIVGLTGGVISLLPTLLILAAIPALTANLITLPIPWDLIGLMLALSISVTLIATLLTAWSASSEKPLTVLRYE
ncbi:MAG: ABC transporter permease [Anaerolineae bacterium]|nr:ABC transporter permease [Anaerolineae bacterium]